MESDEVVGAVNLDDMIGCGEKGRNGNRMQIVGSSTFMAANEACVLNNLTW